MDDRQSCQLLLLLLLQALVLLTLLGTANGYCKQGSEWIEYNGSCYHWSRTPVNWFKAELNCKKFGDHLVSIGSQSDSNFLLRLTQCSSAFWIGMVNTDSSLKGQVRGFEWWDGTSHNYTTLVPQTTAYYDCVYSGNDGRWHPYFCQYTAWGYVCKAPAAVQGIAVDKQQVRGSVEQHANIKEQPQDANAVWDTTTGTPPPSNFSAATSWPRPTKSPIECQRGWQLLDNSCYFMSANRTNYFNAQMSCQAMGASVASILTLREHTLLTVAIGCNSPMWIGLEKARPCFKQPSKDHCWVWMDRNPVNYFEWAPSQTLDRRDAECVIIDGQWKVINCYLDYRYICKKSGFELKNSD